MTWRPRLQCALAAVVAVACSDLAPAPSEQRPTVQIQAPSSDARVPFNETFHLSARAQAPQGTLIQLQVVLRGAVNTRTTVPLSGTQRDVELDLAVPQDALLGPDLVPLDLVVVAEAAVNGHTVTSAPAGVTLRLTDQTAPSLDVRSPDALERAPDGFDFAFLAGQPFRLELDAEDAIGGVIELGLDAPQVLGGLRARVLPVARSASLDVVFSPPTHGDFEIVAYAVDVAAEPNQSRRTIRVRVGAGGRDADPPIVTLDAPATVQCAATASVSAQAIDLDSGVERLNLRVDDVELTRYGPSPGDPSRLTLTSTFASPRPAGATHLVQAWARDAFGQTSPTVTATITAIDTLGPVLDLPRFEPLIPGRALTATISVDEACGALDSAVLAFIDGAGTSTSAQATLTGPRYTGPVRFLVPDRICTLQPVDAVLTVVDDQGNPSNQWRGQLEAQDRRPPRIQTTVLLPGTGVRPGQNAPVSVEVLDVESGVRSATVTVEAVGLAQPPVLDVVAESWPTASCDDRGTRVLVSQVTLPPDVRFVGPAQLRIRVDAEDHAGMRTSSITTLPIIDDAPPAIRFLGPDPTVPLLGARTTTVSIAVADLNHDVAGVRLDVTGPATVDGGTSAFRALGAASGTVTFSLRADPFAPLDAPVELLAVATDTSSPAVSAQARRSLTTCGAPAIAGVSPARSPVTGDVALRIDGARFVPGATRFSIRSVPLDGVLVTSASVALAHLPAGSYAPGIADVVAENLCGAAGATATLPGGFRFVAPPTIRLLRPSSLAGATPGALLYVVAGARGDGVPLLEIGAQIAGQAAAVLPGAGLLDTLDATLLVPATATSAISLSAWAIDALGQRVAVPRAVPLDGPTPTDLSLQLPRRTLARTEVLAYSVVVRGKDDHRRDATATATVTSDQPSTVRVLGPGRLQALAVGTATLTARLGGLQHTLPVRVVDDALVMAAAPLLLSPRPAVGTSSPAAVPIEVWYFSGGRATDVSAQASLTVLPSTLAATQGVRITAGTAGLGQIEATVPSLPGRRARRALWVSPTLDVPAGARVDVPSEQTFDGGLVSGTVVGSTPAATLWRIAIAAGNTLTVAPGGRLDLSGDPGWIGGAGGDAGPGGAGGGGSPPGRGDPAGASPGALAGGDGGGPAGGAGGPTSRGGGAGGGAVGAGGAGGHVLGDLPGRGGSGGLFSGVGGGGAGFDGSGGGGGGAIATLLMTGAHLALDGEIWLDGGPGGAATSTTAAGGGGAGGRLRVDAGILTGVGLIRVAGGPGGDGATGGGGGGGGQVILQVATPPSPFIDVDRAAGVPGAGAATSMPARGGAPGAVQR